MVIVLLIAVTDDLRNKCVKANINYVNWDSHNRYHEQCDLLFVTMEHTIESMFLNHLQIMHEMRILKRIVMNEAHVSLTYRDFQLDMKKLMIMMRMMSI